MDWKNPNPQAAVLTTTSHAELTRIHSPARPSHGGRAAAATSFAASPAPPHAVWSGLSSGVLVVVTYGSRPRTTERMSRAAEPTTPIRTITAKITLW